MKTLSVIIITFNEESNIRACLESVNWADEIIVLDSGSCDKTVAIAREYTKQVIVTDWPGYGVQKQRALEKATCDWVLSIDADERVSAELQEKIKYVLKISDYEGYRIRRPLIFYGKQIRYANGLDYHLCLFQRTRSRFNLDIVHEKVCVDGKVGYISEPLYHHSFKHVGDLLIKTNTYSILSAKKKFQKKQKSSLFKAVTHALWMFFKIYIIKRGFLDGKEGFVLAVSFAEGSYYRYVHLMYLWNDNT